MMKNSFWYSLDSHEIITLGLHLISVHLFVLIRGLSSNPIISYCSSGKDSLSVSKDCKFTFISNSTFEFGKIDENVVWVTSRPRQQFVFLKCEAPYPIRWLAPKPLGSVHYISTDETNRLGMHPLSKNNLTVYIQAVVVKMRERFMPKLRCESYLASTKASEVFINARVLGSYNENVWTNIAGYSVPFAVHSDGSNGYFIIPAFAQEFQGNYTIPIIKHDSEAARLAIVDDNCAECICKASSHCEKFPCDSENVCGGIPKEYYDPNIALNGCNKREDCARGLIQNYYLQKKYGKTKYDCNVDGILSCEDFFLMHVKYNNETCATLNSVGSGNTTTLADCLKKNKLTFTRIRYHPKDYDPRIGLKVYEWPNENFEYEFTIPWELDRNADTFVLKPLPEDRMDAKISYNPSLDEILCEITSLGRYGQPNILVGNCASFPECQLKFEPLWPSVFSSGYELLSGQFEEIKSSESTPYRSFATKFSQGYLECSGNYRGEFLSKIDYFFTGLDNRKYLMSDPFPQEGIIKMSTKLEQPVRVGTRYSVDCKISTFVLLPNIQFVLGFENGNETLVSVTSQTPETIIENTDAITNTSTIIWKLHVTIKAGLNKITCYAPRINSSKWAQSEINIKVATDQVIPEMNSNASTSFGFNEPVEQLHPKINLTDSTRPGVNVNDATALVYEYVKIGGGIAGVIVILIVLLIIYVATRRRVASFRKIFYIIRRVIVLNLSPEEVKEFLVGTALQNDHHSESRPVESRPFNPDYKICNKDLKTGYNDDILEENKVLGSGQFGIVHQGQYRNQQVAIKSCKPNADLEYFRAFLLEIKVMAFIGEHENIVKFLGAVVDDLAEGKCLGVIELSRFGNLNNYLRKSSTQPSVDYKNIDEMELQGTLPLPVLLHFCTQIAKGMDFIEQKNVIHGDLATRNVLVFEKHVVKITDFGLSRKLYTRSNYTKKSKVPLPWAWMALESLCFNEYSPKTDVWSFGVTVWEILSKGPTPYSGTAWTPDFADQVEAGLRLTKPGLAPDNVYNFMMTCWENKPQNRPTFTECVQFFSSLEPKLQRN